MKKLATVLILASAGLMSAVPGRAAEPAESGVTLEFGADLVSSYIWRGQELGGFSLQPSATLTWNKPALSLGVWASAELFETAAAINMTEFDITLTWSPIEALSVGLTDYYLSGCSYFSGWRWNSTASHNLEVNVGYDFGPLAISWNTCLTGPDHSYSDGSLKRNYSTYVELSAPYKVGGIEGSAAVGACLWEDSFTSVGNQEFNVCNISLSAEKELFGLPFKGQVIFNPQTDNAYFVVGLTF